MAVTIAYGQVDVSAKADSKAESDNKQPWVTMEDLGFDELEILNYSSNELNRTILDGSFEEFPDDPSNTNMGYWSDVMSDDKGLFMKNPVIKIKFSRSHKSTGITLHFDNYNDDYANKVSVVWYDQEQQEIASGEFEIDSPTGIVEKTVTDYWFIKIEFISTNNPLRYVKLFGIDYGITRMFTDDEIDSGTIIEEINPIGDYLTMNTIDFVVKSHERIYSPVSEDASDNMLMKMQPLIVTQNKNGENQHLGTFFLDSWKDENSSGIEYSFSGSDAISVLENHVFYGDIYDRKLVTELFDEIFSICFPTGLIGWKIDEELKNETVTGWIPYTNCRTALTQICFSIGAVVDTSRSKYVWIYPREIEALKDNVITSNDYQKWSNFKGLNDDPSTFYNYATIEPNYTVLDGSFDEFPDDPTMYNMGWCSFSMSDENGNFEYPPTLYADFETAHKGEGITIYFPDDEHPNKLRIKWLDSSGNTIHQDIYEPYGNPTIIQQDVSNYRRVEIEVLETLYPFRYAKISAIVWGVSFDIPLSQIYEGGEIATTDYYSGVEIVSATFKENDEQTELLNEELPEGEYELKFGSPHHSFEISGARIVSSSANHVIINVDDEGTVILIGKTYIESNISHRIFDDLAPGEIESVFVSDSCKIIDNKKANKLKMAIFDYLKNRVYIESEIVLKNREVGYIAKMETYELPVVGTIEKIELNIRSIRSRVRVVGNPRAIE